jgi:hypothetical protein
MSEYILICDMKTYYLKKTLNATYYYEIVRPIKKKTSDSLNQISYYAFKNSQPLRPLTSNLLLFLRENTNISTSCETKIIR